MAEWKYVMFELNKRHFPVMFPGELIHADVARAMGHAIREHAVATSPNSWSSKPVSAGFCGSLIVPSAHGKSETLGLSSRKEDRSLINLWPYDHGRGDCLVSEAMIFEAVRRSMS